MDIEIDRQRIVNKFKRNGHFLNKVSLQLVTDHLRQINNPNKRLDQIIKKMNEMVINDQQQLNDGTLKLAIQLLSHRTDKGKSFNSYQSFTQHLNKWCIYNITPYESKQRYFVDKPDPSLFQFVSQDYIKMNLTRFKQIRDYNMTKLKSNKNYTFIGVLFEKYEILKNKIMLQNQINQIQLVFPNDFNHELFLIPGCTYIAQGQFKNRDLQLTVTSLKLPQPLPHNKNNILNHKFKYICENISLSKSGLDFAVQDFKKYDVIYNKVENKGKPIMIFGNVKINLIQIRKINQIIKKYPNKAQCLILMIGEGGHEEIDLKKQFGQDLSIYIIPHMNSQGPRILPKTPILKHFYNAKILTNPARLSIYGKQCIILNYPLVKNLYSKSLISKQNLKENQKQIARKVSAMLYSQNNVAITNKIFWKQSSYFDINCENLIFISDKACNQVHYTQGNNGGFVSVGNFLDQKQFICFLPHITNGIQLCQDAQ